MFRRNCNNCDRSGPLADQCSFLTGDAEVGEDGIERGRDVPVLRWLEREGMRADGTVAETADGCPAWRYGRKEIKATGKVVLTTKT